MRVEAMVAQALESLLYGCVSPGISIALWKFIIYTDVYLIAGSAFQAQHKYRVDQLVVVANQASRVHHGHQSFEAALPAPITDRRAVGILIRPLSFKMQQSPSSVASRLSAVQLYLSC